MDLKDIKPKVKGVSDKYSWQLFRYFQKTKHSINHVRVIFDAHSWFDGSKIEFNKDNLNTTQIWIGFMSEDEWLTGSRLNTIIGSSHNKYQVWANPWIRQHEYVDITDWFWDEYIKVGRCIWDREHDGWLMDDKERFTYEGNTRVCNWCGEKHKKVIEEKVEIKKIEKWICA